MTVSSTGRIVNFLGALPAKGPAKKPAAKAPSLWPFLTASVFVACQQQAPEPANNSAPVAPLVEKQDAQVPVYAWEKLAPYVARHTGLRSPQPKHWSFDLGGDFGDLDPKLDAKIDALVKQAMSDIAPVMGSVMRRFFNETTFAGIDNFAEGEPRRLELARRLWESVKSDPTVIYTLQVQLARALAGKLKIAEVNLESRPGSLSSKAFVTWTEILPYVRGAILLETRPRLENGKIAGDELLRYICGTNNNLSVQMSAADIDGKVMETVVMAMIEEDQREDSLFHLRLEQAIQEAKKTVGFQSARPEKPVGMSEEDFAAKIRVQRQEEASKMTRLVCDKLSGDLAWKFSTLGFLNAAFEEGKLPPIVLP